MKPEVHPVYALRAYAWALIKKNSDLTEAQYGGIVPVTPLSEEPEITNLDLPLIVYGYDEQPTNDVFVERDGSITFIVKDQNFRRLTKLLNVLAVGFGRWDDAAKDINKYIWNNHQAAMGDLRFSEVHVSLLDGGTPEETEGGRQSGMLTASFCYYVNYDVDLNL